MAVGPPEAAQLAQQRRRQRHQALLVALADDAQKLIGGVDGAYFQGGGLADPQAAGIHEGEAGLVDRVADPAQELTDLRIRQSNREASLLRRANPFSPRTAANCVRGS